MPDKKHLLEYDDPFYCEDTPEKQKKIGRNDPCPCGSGKNTGGAAENDDTISHQEPETWVDGLNILD